MQADINDTRSASEKLAAAQKQVADSMSKDMKAIAAAADVVRDSLGPEMVAAIESSGRSVEDQVQEWRKLGLTLDEIKMDSGQLADGLKALDTAGRQSSGAVGDGFKKMSAAADNSRSVMANLAGNAISEMPLVAGSIGPVNMALGQLVEYAVDGNIKLSGLAKLAGPMAGVGVAVSLVADHMEQVAKTKAFNKERVEAFTKALREGATAAEAWDAALTGDDKKLEFIDYSTGDVSDLTDELYRAGVTWEEYRSHLSDTREEFDAWVAANFAYKNGESDRNNAFNAGIDLMDKMSEAEKKLTMETFVYGDATDDAAAATKRASAASKALTGYLEDQTAAAQEAVDSVFDLESAQLDLAESTKDLAEQQAEAERILADSASTDAQKEQALIDLRQAQIGTGEAAKNAAEEFAKAQGAQDGSRASAMLQIGELERLKAKYPELTAEIDVYIKALERIPGVVTTNVGIKYGGGAGGTGVGGSGVSGDTGKVKTINTDPSAPATSSFGDDGRGQRGGGPIIVQLMLDGRAIAEITAYQEQQRRGSR